MSIVCAAMKNGVIAISADTVTNFGSIQASAKYKSNATKLHSVNGSIIGIVGWQAVENMVEHLIVHDRQSFRLNNRMEIFATMLQLHGKLKEDYFVETNENDDEQPVESSQLSALIVNKQGIFEVGSYREVNEYHCYWAIGSGKRIALGAMHALYDKKTTARAVVEAGVKAAAEFDDGCGLPLKTRTMRLKT